MKKTKKLTALLLSFMLIINVFITAVPVSAEAGISKTYAHDGYTVEYKVNNEWTGNQNIEVKITNTGDEVISNWAMGYNAFGEINGLWNARIYGHQGTEYILCGAGYNSEIEPGKSTNFGYTLTGDNFKIPQNIVNTAKRIDKTDEYNVYYNVTGDFGSTYQAEMVIENISDTDITAWQLSFDGNITIDNIWNAKLVREENGRYTVKNAEHNSVIYAGSSVRFNFSGAKNAVNAVLNVPVITEPVITEPEITVTEVQTEPNETELSESAGGEITEPVTEPVTKPITEPLIEEYGEVQIGNYSLTCIDIPLEFDFEIDPEIDSDGDGLPDYIEKEIGTDRYNADTDGDGLSDGYEYYTLGTDPAKADTDDNGISDADEDFDGDGLTNLEEYSHSTDPFSKDTDYDGLSDYDEVNVYHTDPLKFDTDGDIVSDGDEITLGLDPLNPATNGYPDSEYTTVQTVGADSSALDYINTIDGNPYTISVDITAAGVAENCLTAGESGYSYQILQNGAVLGVVPELSYSDGLSVTDVVIKFNLDNSAVTGGMGVFDEDLQGVNRYNVFKYFEDTNMFLPVETAYDEETNTVSAHVDEVGTYCLIDMEKWLSSLENMPSGNYYEGGDNEPANIVFCLDTGNISDNESFEAAKADIKLITEDAFNRYSDIKVYLYYQQFGSNFKASNQLLTDTDGNNYFTGYEEAEAALDKLETYMIKSSFRAYDFVEATQFMIDKIDTCDQNIIAMYHITADERVMGSINAAKKLTQTVRNSKYTTADEEEMQRIHVSTICPNSDKPFNTDSYAYELAELSGGIAVTGYDNAETELQTAEVEAAEVPANSAESKTYTSVKNNLTEILGEGNNGTYKIISSTGLTAIKLKAQLKAASKTDTDEDGIYDWDEVCIEAIEELKENKISDGKIKSGDLPSLLQVMSYYNKNKKGYVCGGFEKYMNANGGNPFSALNCTFILPINSDPTEVDSDGDGITDGSMLIGNAKYTDDEKPLKYSYKYYDEELYTIHLKYPKAEFNFSEINMAASEFIQLQYDTNSSMTEIKIDNPYIETDRARISKLENQGIKCDYNFYYANYNGIMNYVEPSTYLDERHIMAFLDMKDKNKSACMNQARNMLINTYFDQPGEIDNYAKYFVEAANENEMSVSYLISKVIIESAAGSKGSCSRLCAGNNYKGNMIYNMYVIGATDGDAVNQGMKTAYENGWTTEELAIKGGARWINEHYILVGQDTLYKQRYNIIGCVNNGFISHQYATDIAMAYSKAEVMYNKSFSIVKYEKIFFEIPIYSDYKTSN